MAFPVTPLDVTVEFAVGVDGAWVDVTAWVYARSAISIKRGRADEQSHVGPSTCSMTINNRDGRFSPRNPTGPYYGVIGRNTPVRVTTNVAASSVRFYGEVSSWPSAWDVDGVDVWTTIEAAGILRRLGQGRSPVVSPIYTGVRALAGADAAIAYWPMEQGRGLTSGLTGAPTLRATGTPMWGQSTGITTSNALPIVGLASFDGVVPIYAASSYGFFFQVYMDVSSFPAVDTVFARVFSTGTAARYDYFLEAATEAWGVKVYNAAGTLLDTLTTSSGSPTQPKMSGKQWRLSSYGGSTVSGGSTYSRIYLLGQHLAADGIQPDYLGLSDSMTVAFTAGIPNTMGSATRVVLNPDRADLSGIALGHLNVRRDYDLNSSDNYINGYPGEYAGTRMVRLCAEEGIPFTLVGTAASTVKMGPQRAGPVLDLLNECADADLGILYEPRTTLGLAYRTRASLYNQAAAVTFPYGRLAVLEPVDDDQATRNDVTVTRTGGSSARAALTTGALSSADPPLGVGLYDTTVTVNVASDDDLDEQAGWRLRLGTLDETRYPRLVVDLAADVALAPTVLALDLGGIVNVTGPPAWLASGTIVQMVQGIEESLSPFGYDVELNCTPGTPWAPGVFHGTGAVTATTARYSPDDTTTAAPMTTTGTSLQVASLGARWTAADVDLPYDVSVAGEVMTVTAVTGGAIQVMTVVRSVNGVVKTHAILEPVTLAVPAFYAL